MSAAAKNKWWRICQKCLFGIRLCILSATLLLLAVFIYLNEVGLPNFLKPRLLGALQARGVDLQFSRLRWLWYRGFVAENVRFGAATADFKGPRVSAQSVALKLNRPALFKFKIKVDALTVNHGTLFWPLEEPGEAPVALSVTNIQTQIRFLTNDQWELDEFSAAFAGAKLRVSGYLMNASAVRDWGIFHGRQPAEPGLLTIRLRALARAVDKIKFSEPPDLNVLLHGDAKHTESFEGHFAMDAPGADTPWGVLTRGSLLAHLQAATNAAGLSKIELKVKADEVATHWASTRHFKLDATAFGSDQLANLVTARMEISAARFITRWLQATNARFTAQWTHSLTNFVPDAGTGELTMDDARTPWVNADQLRLAVHLKTPNNQARPQADETWGWWARLQPYVLDWNCHLREIRADDFECAEVGFGGDWQAPLLTITNLHTELYQGKVDAHASLNVATRRATFAGQSDFDIKSIYPLLPAGGRDWMERQQFTWEKPPVLSGSGSIILPAWTNRQPDWKEEIRPTLSLAAHFQTGAATYRTLPVTSAQSHLTYTNLVWTLPDLEALRPEGKVLLTMTADDSTRDFYFGVHSSVDLKIARGLLDANMRHGVDWAVFTEPPIIDARIWGRWHDLDRLGARAHVSVTNFSFRGEPAASLTANLAYTNKFLLITDPRVERSNQVVTATSFGIDLAGKRGFLTNGFSTMEPSAILHSLGPKIARHIEPYHFIRPPIVHAYGVIPFTEDISVADLHFAVDGGPFEWLKFHLPHVSGNVDWVGENLKLNGVKADFYHGTVTARAEFDFRIRDGADYSFDALFTGANLQALMADLTTHSNHLEGILSGNLNITHANSQDLKSWFGKGHVDLTDGLIWEFPIFGLLSPVLDTISPGLGKSRATSATADFIITNSVIRSDNLKIYSPTVRLLYDGTVDFDTRVDATVEAEVGRDAPLVGPLVSTVLMPFGKLFETKVTGTLTEPKQAPLHFVTRIFTPFIHPFHTLKELFSPDTSSSTGAGTNSAPVFPVAPASPLPPASPTGK